MLTAGFADNKEELEEIEDLFADAVRLAAKIGDLATAKAIAGHAAALAAESEIPHRQANALYCRGLLDHDATGLLAAAERYGEASRPLLSAKALEAAAGDFVGADDRDQARAAFTRAVEIYTSLGAVTDVARLRTRFRAHGIRRGPARQAPAGAERLGQPDADRDQDRRVGGGGIDQPRDRRQAVPVPADRRDPRLPHPEEARRPFADGHRPRGSLADHRVEVIEGAGIGLSQQLRACRYLGAQGVAGGSK